MVWQRVLGVATAVLLALTARATNVGGPVVSDTTWTLAGSPYVVTAAVIVGNNATLSIEPGVTVRFNLGLGITVGSQAFGVGALRAVGSPAQKITFTSSDIPGQPGRWKDIFFTDRTIDAVFNASGQYVSGSVLEHCIVEFAGASATISGAITITDAAPLISHCEIRHSARSGIYAASAPTVPGLRVLHSHIHHNDAGGNQHGGGAWLTVGALRFEGNLISNNSGSLGGGLRAGYHHSGGLAVEISNNTFLNNTASSGGAIHCAPHLDGAGWLLTGNRISGNAASSGGGLFVVANGNTLTKLVGNLLIDNVAQFGGGACFATDVARGGGTARIEVIANGVIGNTARGTGGGDGYGGGFFVENRYIAFVSNPALQVDFDANAITFNRAEGGPAGGTGLGGGMYISEYLYQGGDSSNTTISLVGDLVAGVFNTIANNAATLGDAIYNNMIENQNGINDIGAGHVCWGGLDPNPTVTPNLIWDYFDDPQKSIVQAFIPGHVTAPNCQATSICGQGLIADCNGRCAPVSWIHDGVCDNGFYAYGGFPISFNCQQFGNDGGACNSPPPRITDPPNRGVPVSPPTYGPASPPMPTQNKLILITHGWNTKDSTDPESSYNTFWIPLRNAIAASVGPEWKVQLYDWTLESDTGFAAPGTADIRFGPDLALSNALVHGFRLGREIAQGGYQHVHLIAHSAGSGLIAAAASRLRNLPLPPTIQTTFLDAFAGTGRFGGVGNYKQSYGGNSNWSDHYFTEDVACPLYTNLHLEASFNVEVSGVQPLGFNLCLASHRWPPCLYRYTVDGGSVDACAPPTSSVQLYGFPLGFEKWTGPDGFAGWLATRLSQQALGRRESLSGAPTAAMLLARSSDAPVNLMAVPAAASSSAAVQMGPASLMLMTQPASTSQPAPAWANFELTTTQVTKYIDFEMSFASSAGAEGLVTTYVNGIRCGIVDEKYIPPGTLAYSMPTPELPPGQHIVSFRLDSMNATPSTAVISDVATGRTSLVAVCRADFDGQNGADLLDIFAFLTAWFAGSSAANYNGVGGVELVDIFAFLTDWFAGC